MKKPIKSILYRYIGLIVLFNAIVFTINSCSNKCEPNIEVQIFYNQPPLPKAERISINRSWVIEPSKPKFHYVKLNKKVNLTKEQYDLFFSGQKNMSKNNSVSMY